MTTVAIIGAGSMEFTRQVVSDLARSTVGREAAYRLVDIDPERLETARAMVERILREAGGHGPVTAYGSVQGALTGVDYVVNAIQVGGYRATRLDFDIPARYGVPQTIADTLGIGGIFRGLRTLPPVLEIAATLEAEAPDAVLLNYTNPMSMLILGLGRAAPQLQAYGLCHSVWYTAETLADYLEIPFEELEWTSAGINHMAWMLSLRRKGEDLYPRLRAAGQRDPVRSQDRVRFELLDRLGYFVTESSEHNAEYSAFFLPHPDEIRRLEIPVGEYIRRSEHNLDEYAEIRRLLADPGATLWLDPSPEYAPAFIAAREEGRLWWFQGNVVNHGLIDNLPTGAAVEVPCFVDQHGVFTTRMGPLPEQLAAMNRVAINVQLLTVEAALTGDRDRVYQAAMLDPLCASLLTLDQIWHLVDDLIEAHGPALPPLRAHRVWSAGATP